MLGNWKVDIDKKRVWTIQAWNHHIWLAISMAGTCHLIIANLPVRFSAGMLTSHFIIFWYIKSQYEILKVLLKIAEEQKRESTLKIYWEFCYWAGAAWSLVLSFRQTRLKITWSVCMSRWMLGPFLAPFMDDTLVSSILIFEGHHTCIVWCSALTLTEKLKINVS